MEFINKFGETEIFAKDPHHPVYAMSNHGAIEWRDSYALFNTKLEEATKGLPHAKLDGEDFDYTKKRFSWTPLTDKEKQYCINDVWGLCECVKRNMTDYGDTVYSLPLTSTGYVRRDVKRLMYPYTRCHMYPADSYENYQLLRACYRGGNTHANRWYAGSVISDTMKVDSYDRSSSYPDVIVNDLFPVNPLVADDDTTLDHLYDLKADGYAFAMRVQLCDVKLKSYCTPVPYLAIDKCEFPIGIKQTDNGRIIEAHRVTVPCTDLDWDIICQQYTFDRNRVVITDLCKSKYEYLPNELRDYVKDLYIKKTELKGVNGSEDTYRCSKAKINSVYGMMVQRVENIDVVFDEDANELQFSEEEKDHITNYYGLSKYRPMPYRWGVWVSAWARVHLQKLIDYVGSLMVYTDTDSVKFIHKDDIDLTEFNKFFIERSKENGAYATDRSKGVTHYMGAYEYEGTYDGFVTMGAKKYAYTAWEKNKKTKELEYNTHITVSGVPKEDGAKELKEAGGLSAFKEGMVFNAGKLRPKYNDADDYGEVEVYDCYGNSGKVKITSNACLLDTAYKLGYGKEYKNTLESLPQLLDEYEDVMRAYKFFIDRGYTT